LSGALAFPLAIPGVGDRPLLDAIPREIGILVCAYLVYRMCVATARLRARLGECFAAGLVYFAVLLYWIDIAMVRYGRMSQWQAVPVLAFLVAYCALFWGALPAVTHLLSSRLSLPAAACFPLAVVALEWLRSVLLSGFPWGLWGYSQARNLLLVQIASLAGVYGVSFIIALGGALVAQTVDAGPSPRAWLRLTLSLAAFHLAGWTVLATRKADQDLGLRVALVQGNIEQNIKNRSAEHRHTILARYRRLTRQAIYQGADFVVWPESAWPGQVHSDTRRLPDVALHAPLLVGVSIYRTRPRQAFSSALWLGPGGSIQGRYDKQHLVPFGEYVPLRAILPVDKLAAGMTDYSAGTSAAPLGKPPTGVLICYDGIFPQLARARIRAGARVLANLTNDGWYGASSAPYQHRDFYVLRAVETDRWIMRAANTGVSFFVGPDGRIHNPTDLLTTTFTIAQIWPRDSQSIYVRVGDWLVAVAVGLIVAAVLDELWRWAARYRRRPPGGVDKHPRPDSQREDSAAIHDTTPRSTADHERPQTDC
jgi:apolipoprotein N-acyltransferase